jgi:hypothetical protein
MEHPAVASLETRILDCLNAEPTEWVSAAWIATMIDRDPHTVAKALRVMANEQPPRVEDNGPCLQPLYRIATVAAITCTDLAAEHKVGLAMARSGKYKATDYSSLVLGWLAARGMVNVVDGAVTITARGIAMDDAVKVAQAARRGVSDGTTNKP